MHVVDAQSTRYGTCALELCDCVIAVRSFRKFCSCGATRSQYIVGGCSWLVFKTSSVDRGLSMIGTPANIKNVK